MSNHICSNFIQVQTLRLNLFHAYAALSLPTILTNALDVAGLPANHAIIKTHQISLAIGAANNYLMMCTS